MFMAVTVNYSMLRFIAAMFPVDISPSFVDSSLRSWRMDYDKFALLKRVFSA